MIIPWRESRKEKLYTILFIGQWIPESPHQSVSRQGRQDKLNQTFCSNLIESVCVDKNLKVPSCEIYHLKQLVSLSSFLWHFTLWQTNKQHRFPLESLIHIWNPLESFLDRNSNLNMKAFTFNYIFKYHMIYLHTNWSSGKNIKAASTLI